MATIKEENALIMIYLRAITKKLGISTEELESEVDSLRNRISEGKDTILYNNSPKAVSDANAIADNLDRFNKINEDKEEAKSYPSVEDAPEWKIVFKVNTSEGISTQKVIQQAWTEKQAIFLGRTEQLFHTMNELVKAKQIQAKWNILESAAEKIV